MAVSEIEIRFTPSTDALHAELDRIEKRLERLKELAREVRAEMGAEA